MNKKLLLLVLVILMIFVGFKSASATNTTGDTHTLEGDIGEYSVVRLDKVKFTLDGEDYSMKVVSVGNGLIKVKYVSMGKDTIYATANTDETAKSDLDYDGIYDVAVTLKSTSLSRAEITFEVLTEKGQTKKEFEDEQKAADELAARQKAAKLDSSQVGIVIIAVMLVLLSAIFYWQMKKKK